MGDTPLKLLGSQISVTTANTVGGYGLIRAYAAANTLVTITAANSTVLGTMTIAGGISEILIKSPTDTITANAALLCTPIAWR